MELLYHVFPNESTVFLQNIPAIKHCFSFQNLIYCLHLKGGIPLIRCATMKEWDEICAIYARAREYMRQTGNPNQWKDNSPALSALEEDIRLQQLYLLEDAIEGTWLNDAPYAAIHRVASAGKRKGVLQECLDYCSAKYQNLRIDTHFDNKIMQHLLEKYGFQRCGTIYLENGDPRIAYQRIR